MKRQYAVGYLALVVLLSLAGCNSLGGELRPDGSITPCSGYHTDNQACGYATWNSKVIGQVEAGLTKEQVREIMKHDAERREFDGPEERWFYITDYDAEQMTVIVFTNGIVSGMRQAPWKDD